MKSKELTDNCKVETSCSGLSHFEVYPTPVDVLVAVADVKNFEPGMVGPRARVKYHAVVSKHVGIQPVRLNILHIWYVYSTSGICSEIKIDTPIGLYSEFLSDY